MSEDKDWPRRKYASEHERKCHKPILEKKRRARINKSLDQLKSLLLETVKGDGGHYSKLEKADILEMTVRHLKDMQRQQLHVAMVMDPSVVQRYECGYKECASEVNRYLSTIDGIDGVVKSRLTEHLHNCKNNVSHQTCSVLGQPQMALVQQYTGPISPPIYGQMVDIQTQRSPLCDITFASGSNMYSSSTPHIRGPLVGHIGGEKKRPEATITRPSECISTIGLTGVLSERTNSNQTTLTGVLCDRTNRNDLQTSICKNTNSVNHNDKENISQQQASKKELKPLRQFIPLNDISVTSIQRSGVGQYNEGQRSQLVYRADQINNQSHVNDNHMLPGDMANFNATVKEESMWRPW